MASNFGFKTLRKRIASGSDNAMTAIMKARVVPSAAPFSSRAEMIGTMPAALEYIGTPKSWQVVQTTKLPRRESLRRNPVAHNHEFQRPLQ